MLIHFFLGLDSVSDPSTELNCKCVYTALGLGCSSNYNSQVSQHCAPQLSAAAPGGTRPRDPTLPRSPAGLNQICARNSNLLASTRNNITIFLCRSTVYQGLWIVVTNLTSCNVQDVQKQQNRTPSCAQKNLHVATQVEYDEVHNRTKDTFSIMPPGQLLGM